MKLVGRMHHHKYNGMDFACMECILHSYFFFPPLYFLPPIFLDIDRLYIFYKIFFFSGASYRIKRNFLATS